MPCSTSVIFCIVPSEEPNPKPTGQVLTVPITHHFPSKQWQQTGTSNTALLSSLIHDDVTHRFFDSEREAFPRFWGRRYPGQSIMLCVLMMDSCRRGTRSSQRQQAWKGVNQLSGVVIWRTARLWLEFSIRTSTIHHATRERGGTHTFLHQPFLLWAKRVLRHLKKWKSERLMLVSRCFSGSGE